MNGSWPSALQIGLLAALSLPAQPKNTSAIEFVKIAPGEFMMGCPAGDNDCTADEKPAHLVQISKAFELGKYEVTQSQWQAAMGSNPATIKGDDRPVETVTKDEVHDFLARLNMRNDGFHYRLPTEAEWEYAARAGTTGAPTVPLDDIAWYAGNSGDETHPVGSRMPNAWGFYDMLGNVREWVEDLFAMNYYSSSPAVDPTGPLAGQGGPQRGGGRGQGRAAGGRGRGGRQLPVARGGGWDNTAAFVRTSARYHYYGPTLRVSDIGFRAARDPAN